MPNVNAFEINGVIDTNQNVLSNIHSLCEAAGCWLSYDITTGLWSVVINQAGTSIKSFNDNNIIGSINITGTGINEAYNKVSVEFPHKDLRDQTDYVDLVIPEEDRYPNELDNTLNINLKLTNDPVQAQYIGTVQLKQSRVDRIIEFRTDYTSLGLRAGDIIDVTESMYGFTNKLFRITKVVEEDQNDGSLIIAITGLEYDADVYNTSGLIRQERLKKTGITPKSNNAILSASDRQNAIIQSNPMVYSFGSGYTQIAETALSTSDQTFLSSFPNPTGPDTYNLGYSYTLPYSGQYKINYLVNFAANWAYDGSGNALLANTIRKRCRINIVKSVSGGVTRYDTGIWDTTSIAKGEDALADIFQTGFFTGSKGDQILFYFDCRVDFGPNHPDAGGYAGAASGVYVSGELYYLGT